MSLSAFTQPSAGARPSSVCIIEEDEAVRDALSALLQAYGYSVLAMTDGSALDSPIARHAVGCIVAEAGLLRQAPEDLLDGTDGDGRPIPVILMTRSIAKRAPAERVRPGTILLHKPFSPTQLLNAVGAAMDGIA